jgi:hypothetical protein
MPLTWQGSASDSGAYANGSLHAPANMPGEASIKSLKEDHKPANMTTPPIAMFVPFQHLRPKESGAVESSVCKTTGTGNGGW